MNVYVTLFGNLADIAGTSLLVIKDSNDVKSLNDSLQKSFPKLKACNYQIALKNRILSGNESLSNGDEIALLPPFSGG